MLPDRQPVPDRLTRSDVEVGVLAEIAQQMPFFTARVASQSHETRLHRRIGGVDQPAEHIPRPEATDCGIDGKFEETVVEIAPTACDLVVIAHRRVSPEPRTTLAARHWSH